MSLSIMITVAVFEPSMVSARFSGLAATENSMVGSGIVSPATTTSAHNTSPLFEPAGKERLTFNVGMKRLGLNRESPKPIVKVKEDGGKEDRDYSILHNYVVVPELANSSTSAEIRELKLHEVSAKCVFMLPEEPLRDVRITPTALSGTFPVTS
jgi:hypothetical protein